MNTPGHLYIVATPIGNLQDISARALQVLQEVDVIAAEDTRHSRRLLQHHAISTALIALHDHNERQKTHDLIRQIQQGKNIALVSDAGTPLISDPGYQMVKTAKEAGIKVIPIPGPCAFIAALSAAGLPASQFIFIGFLPAKSSQRCQELQMLSQESRTLIFYEAPHRIVATLKDMATIMGTERPATIARELTKTFETIHTASLGELYQWTTADDNQQKGEFVILVQGKTAKQNKEGLLPETERILNLLLAELPLKQAAKLAAEIMGESKNKLYRWALEQNSSETCSGNAGTLGNKK